jgi:hypothetical protein
LSSKLFYGSNPLQASRILSIVEPLLLHPGNQQNRGSCARPNHPSFPRGF